jgi:plastocyanin
MLVRTSLALLIALAACSDSSSSTVDAAPPADAGAPTVTAVTCPGRTVPTISAVNGTNAYTPTGASISVGQIVKFTMPSEHNVVPNPLKNTDTGLNVNFNETKCLMFAKAGTFNFYCGPHGFTGTVTVQ